MLLASKYIIPILTIAVIIVSLIFQSYVLAASSFNWWHIDILSIVVAFISIEFVLLDALVYVLLTAFFIHGFSAVSFGFYIMFYGYILLLSKLFGRQFSLTSSLNRLLFFSSIMLLKTVLLYLLLYVENRSYGIWGFTKFMFPELCSTIILFIPVYGFLNKLYKKVSPLNFL